jgi:pimeloyl-ACP methyl ester carboxylesterase
MKIFFIPGLLCTNQIWGPVNNIRSKYDCHDADVISFNTIEKMSDALINSMPSGEVAIVGISMGGYVAIDAALKLGNKLKKLILINTTSNSVNKVTVQEREKAMQMAENGFFKEILANTKGICYYKPKEEWMLLEERMANEAGAKAYIRQQQAIIDRKNYSNLIKHISADTLIIAGKNDKVVPYQDSLFMAEEIKNASLILLNACGHLSTIEKGDIVLDFIQDFLEM